MSSFLSSAVRAASRTSSRTFTTSTRRANINSASSGNFTSSIRSGIERASAEAHDEAFKAGVVYTLLGVSALGAGYMIVAPKQGKTVLSRDLL